MRYSILVYLVNMSKTLLEAAQYLNSAVEDQSLRAELLENGRQMIGQIQSELKQHQGDLRSELPVKYMETAAGLWESGGTELEEVLQSFAECLPNEVRYQVRAVFFAELGEKWDSMETVYEFMRDDPRFDPVVVLTPIFRQVQDKKGRPKQEVIYKDYLSPMGIPFLQYNKYRLEKDCPDLAFICQPYESCTLKEFWPETIAQYTRLVYLSYFLIDYATEGSTPSLAQFPVYRHAWKVACPTEKQYQFYCRNSAHGGVNALLTGIPKLDKLVQLRKEGPARPKEWDCLEGKTVFLWNSWYSADLSSVHYFDELIEWFQAHEDCALIWRPHPMTDVVTKLYFPSEYKKLQDNIRRINSVQNAVLDRETSFRAAFYYSNAMISDYSSMVPQYLLMDKPTLVIKSPVPDVPKEQFIGDQWRDVVTTSAGIFSFLEQIRAGEDPKAELRKDILQRDMALADGHCAERICETLWTEMHREDL